jgi:uncharacterized glyoxalase superfamily protein PhnB
VYREEGIMAQTAKLPKGYHAVTPQLVFKDATKAIDFYTRVFGAKEVLRMPGPGGKIWHAELELGDSRFFVMDAMTPDTEPPTVAHPSPASVAIYVPDVDATFKKAVDAGAKVLQPPSDQFWGDRGAGVVDPFGYAWYVATHVRDVSADEMRRASEEAVKRMESGAATQP